MTVNFWEKPLHELDEREWEALCDGCGQCCLKKLQDTATNEVVFTRVVCRLFDQNNSRCTRYPERTTLVPDCLDVKNVDIGEIDWMPATCAYRLRHHGQPLPDWHPLITGSRDAMEAAGAAVAGKVISEQYVHPEGHEEHVIDWVKA